MENKSKRIAVIIDGTTFQKINFMTYDDIINKIANCVATIKYGSEVAKVIKNENKFGWKNCIDIADSIYNELAEVQK